MSTVPSSGRDFDMTLFDPGSDIILRERKIPSFKLSRANSAPPGFFPKSKRKLRKVGLRHVNSAPPDFLWKVENNMADFNDSASLQSLTSSNDWIDDIGIMKSCAGFSVADNILDEFQQDEDSTTEFYFRTIFENGKEQISCVRVACGRVVSHENFQGFVVFLITLNSITMGISTFDFVTDHGPTAVAFEIIDQSFLVLFTAELVLEFVYHGLALFLDGWLVFDFLIVVLSWSVSHLSIIRAFRIFRTLRLVNRVEVLRTLVAALLDVLPRMFAIFMLLLLIFYIYGVMCTVLFKDLSRNGQLGEEYFSSLWSSFFTLLQMMTMDYASISRECQEFVAFAPIIFLFFVFTTGFIVYNLMIAVVCDAVATVETFHKKDDEVSVSKLENDGEIDETNQRENDLRNQISVLIQNQREMQAIVQNLVKGLQERQAGEIGAEKMPMVLSSSGLEKSMSAPIMQGLKGQHSKSKRAMSAPIIQGLKGQHSESKRAMSMSAPIVQGLKGQRSKSKRAQVQRNKLSYSLSHIQGIREEENGSPHSIFGRATSYRRFSMFNKKK